MFSRTLRTLSSRGVVSTHLCAVARVATPTRTLFGFGDKKNEGPSKSGNVAERWSRAEEHLKAFRLAEAKAELRSLLQENPNFPNAISALADLLIREGKADEALTILEKPLEQNPNEIAYLSLKGVAYQIQGKYNEALDVFDHALALQPNSIPPILGKAQICTLQGHDEESLSLTDRAITIVGPLLSLAYTNKSIVFLKQMKFEEALQLANKALELTPGAGQALVAKGTALASLGKYNEAMKAFDDVAPHDPARQIAQQQKEYVRQRVSQMGGQQ